MTDEKHVVQANIKPPLPNRKLFDLAWSHVVDHPDDYDGISGLDFMFNVFSAKLALWMTERRLEYARHGRNDIKPSPGGNK